MSMRSAVAVAAVLGGLAVGGAWTTSRPASARVAQGMKWTATLNSMGGGTMKGTASLAPGTGGASSVAMISITGGKAGTAYPWHVHTGKCGANGGGVFGAGGAYKPVTAGADGSGNSTANLAVAAPTTGDYHVNVHASATDMKTIVACGDLSMAM
jgi:hypothetical protein